MEDSSEQLMNDVVTIMFGENETETIKCKKSYLTEKSDYFKALFSSGMIESRNNLVEIKDVDKDVFRELVSYMSSSFLNLSEETVYSITADACRFQISGAMQLCCEFLEKNLSDQTCIHTLECSILYNLPKVYKLARRHIQHYFVSVSQTDEFLSLEVTTLKNILQEKALNVDSELLVYYILERWIDADLENRLQYAKELSQYIHYEDILCETKLLPKLKYLQLPQEEISQDAKQVIRQRFRQVPQALLCIGLHFFDKLSQFDPNIYKLDVAEKFFNIVPESVIADISDVIPNLVGGHGGISVCIDGKDIIVSGGEPLIGRNTWNLGVYSFDTFEKSWSQLTDLQNQRRHHASCVLNRCLFLIGGFGRFRVKLNSMEKYEMAKGNWSTVAPSPEYGFHKAVTVFNNKIYSLFSGNRTLCYMYCPIQDVWTNLQFSIDIESEMFIGAYNFSNRLYARDNIDKIYEFQFLNNNTIKLADRFEHFVHVGTDHASAFGICNGVMYCIRIPRGYHNPPELDDKLKLFGINLIDRSLSESVINHSLYGIASENSVKLLPILDYTHV